MTEIGLGPAQSFILGVRSSAVPMRRAAILNADDDLAVAVDPGEAVEQALVVRLTMPMKNISHSWL